MAQDQKSGDHQSHCDLSSGNHECLKFNGDLPNSCQNISLRAKNVYLLVELEEKSEGFILWEP